MAYLAVAVVTVVIAVIALLFILGSRVAAQSRSESGESHDR